MGQPRQVFQTEPNGRSRESKTGAQPLEIIIFSHVITTLCLFGLKHTKRDQHPQLELLERQVQLLWFETKHYSPLKKQIFFEIFILE